MSHNTVVASATIHNTYDILFLHSHYFAQQILCIKPRGGKINIFTVQHGTNIVVSGRVSHCLKVREEVYYRYTLKFSGLLF